MANKVITIACDFAEAGDVWGKVVNVYDSYPHALAHGTEGLVTVYEVDGLTGTIGSAITQTPPSVGPEVDVNGRLNIALAENAAYYLMSDAGRWGGPLRIEVGTADTTESSSSSS